VESGRAPLIVVGRLGSFKIVEDLFGHHVRVALVQFRDGEFSGAYVHLFQDQMDRLREVEEYDKSHNDIITQRILWFTVYGCRC